MSQIVQEITAKIEAIEQENKEIRESKGMVEEELYKTMQKLETLQENQK